MRAGHSRRTLEPISLCALDSTSELFLGVLLRLRALRSRRAKTGESVSPERDAGNAKSLSFQYTVVFPSCTSWVRSPVKPCIGPFSRWQIRMSKRFLVSMDMYQFETIGNQKRVRSVAVPRNQLLNILIPNCYQPLGR
jgi:hypothetical protein